MGLSVAENNTLTPEQKKTAQQFMAQQPLINGFEENSGQFAGQDNKPVPQVLFKSQGKAGDIYITNTGFTFVFYKIDEAYLKELEEKEKHEHETDGTSGATTSADSLGRNNKQEIPHFHFRNRKQSSV